MKTTQTNAIWHNIASGLLICSVFLFLPSCSEEDDWLNDDAIFKSLTVEGKAYYGPETFTTTSKDPLVVTQILTNPDFKYLENFAIKVQNGPNKTKCKSIEVKIDGVVVISSEDFKKNVNPVVKSLSGLTDQSLLQVNIAGSKAGAFIELLIEGTLQPDVITDIDGSYYHTVQIGDQWWMAENLKVTHFNNGEDIFFIDNEASWEDEWATSISPYGWLMGPSAYCYYNYDAINASIYGLLYNWAAGRDVRNVCPTGWHTPSESEWNILKNYLGENSGGKLKGIGTLETDDGLWLEPNLGATNETGFSALPEGQQSQTTSFNINSIGYWWTTDSHPAADLSPWIAMEGVNAVLSYNNDILAVGGNSWKTNCLSIRCIKD